MAKLKTHPYADLFPMMTAAELDALTADIAAHGLLHPIMLWKGAILDGRNRLLACEKAGIKPQFEELFRHDDTDEDDSRALAFVISANVQRRDLTAAQRAIVAARAMDKYPQRWGGDRRSNQAAQSVPLGRARNDAAREFKVGVNAIQQAKALLAEAPDLAAQVEGQTLAITQAYEELQQRRQQVTQKAKDAERIAEYKEAISNGEMTFEEAMEKVLGEERAEQERIARDEEARCLWFDRLAGFIAWLEEWVATRTDEHLAWYQQAMEGNEQEVTVQRVEAAMRQLERIRTITFGGEHYVQTRSPKARA
jgi:hypothetical protein